MRKMPTMPPSPLFAVIAVKALRRTLSRVVSLTTQMPTLRG